MNTGNGFLLFGHGGSGNRGCEAIVRSTTTMLKREFPDAPIALASWRLDEDRRVGMPLVDAYVQGHPTIRRLSLPWVTRVLVGRVLRDPTSAAAMNFSPVFEAGAGVAACLSIGGDNYCYPRPFWLYGMNRELKRRSRPLVLWGASIEPAAIDRGMAEDLRRFDLIVARESLTRDALARHGIESNVHLHPDPAFTMEPEVPRSLPPGWRDGAMVGVNLSPLVMKHEKSAGVALRSIAALITHITRTSDLSVALVPHVTWAHDNDVGPLTRLVEAFRDSGRVTMVPPTLTAPEYKYLIARCRFFVGARTHATIAAYSSGVPTLVLGYSVKARGIARDLFGDESLVLPVQSLGSPDELVRAFDALREREEAVRETLCALLPDILARAHAAARHLRRLVA